MVETVPPYGSLTGFGLPELGRWLDRGTSVKATPSAGVGANEAGGECGREQKSASRLARRRSREREPL